MPIFVSLRVETSSDESECAQAVIHVYGPLGLEIREGAEGRELTLAYFSRVDDALAAKTHLREELSNAAVEVDQVVDRDWTESHKLLRRPINVGRLCVARPEEAARVPQDRIPVWIPRGEAFGDGEHRSTYLCLDALDTCLAEHPGASVLDVGTGTGILAIAAKKLGAGEVLGIELRESALQEAIANRALNEVEEISLRNTLIQDVEETYDLVIANMMSTILVPLAPEISKRVGKTLILCGLVTPEWERVQAAFEATGLRSVAIRALDVWVRLIFERA